MVLNLSAKNSAMAMRASKLMLKFAMSWSLSRKFQIGKLKFVAARVITIRQYQVMSR